MVTLAVTHVHDQNKWAAGEGPELLEPGREKGWFQWPEEDRWEPPLKASWAGLEDGVAGGQTSDPALSLLLWVVGHLYFFYFAQHKNVYLRFWQENKGIKGTSGQSIGRYKITGNNLPTHPSVLLLLARPWFPALAHGWGRGTPPVLEPLLCELPVPLVVNVTNSAPSPGDVGSQLSSFSPPYNGL